MGLSLIKRATPRISLKSNALRALAFRRKPLSGNAESPEADGPQTALRNFFWEEFRSVEETRGAGAIKRLK